MSEVLQINGVEPTVADGLTEKMSSPVKHLNAVIIDADVSISESTCQNGTSEDMNHNGTASESVATNGDTPVVTVEPAAADTNADIVEPSAPSDKELNSSTDTHMEADKPAESAAVPRICETVAVAEHTTDSKPVEPAVVETIKEDVEPDIAEEKPVEDVTAEPTDSSDVQPAPKKGRKPAGRKSTTPKKSAEEGRKPVVESDNATTEADTEATALSPKRTPKRRHDLAVEMGDEDKTPLLEAPLIVEGKRSRQKVDRLDSNTLQQDKKEPTEYPQGHGKKLSEIPFVESMISKTNPADLKLLHRVAFGRVGAATEVKKHLRTFNGFPFDVDSTDFQKKRKSIESATLADLKTTCGVLGLEKTGKKDELIDSVLKFVTNPSDTGKPVAKQSHKKAANKGKRKSTGSGGKKGAESSAEDDASTEHEDQEEETEEVPEPSPKRGRRSKAPLPEKTSPVSKRGASTSHTRSAKKPAFPSDNDIKSTIKELLKGVNLEEVTMKEMTAKVYEKYPNIDMTTKKDFIKDTVKTLLSSNE